MVKHIDGKVPVVSCTTSPDNLAALRLFLTNDFMVSRFIPNYYGIGKGRFYLEWSPGHARPATGHPILIPVENLDYVKELIDGTDCYVTQLIELPHGIHYRVDQIYEPKEEELSSNESSTSVAFTGILLSSNTFLLGAAVTGQTSFSGDILIFLLAGFLFLTVALLGYTNAIGVVARMRNKRIFRYIRVGNILSEFGGLYPLMHIVPLIVATKISSRSESAGLVGCGLTTIALLIYHYSGLSILERYVRPKFMKRTLFTWLSVTPIFGGVLYYRNHSTVIWSILDGVILGALAIYCAIHRNEE